MIWGLFICFFFFVCFFVALDFSFCTCMNMLGVVYDAFVLPIENISLLLYLTRLCNAETVQKKGCTLFLRYCKADGQQILEMYASL